MRLLHSNRWLHWFVGVETDGPAWTRAAFRKNRERLLNEAVTREFFRRYWRKPTRFDPKSPLPWMAPSADGAAGDRGGSRWGLCTPGEVPGIVAPSVEKNLKAHAGGGQSRYFDKLPGSALPGSPGFLPWLSAHGSRPVANSNLQPIPGAA